MGGEGLRRCPDLAPQSHTRGVTFPAWMTYEAAAAALVSITPRAMAAKVCLNLLWVEEEVGAPTEGQQRPSPRLCPKGDVVSARRCHVLHEDSGAAVQCDCNYRRNPAKAELSEI